MSGEKIVDEFCAGNYRGKDGFKCHFCKVCDGTGCIGEIPGMGGFHDNENFRLNCDGWEVVYKKLFGNKNAVYEEEILKKIEKSRIALAPISGAVENVGFSSEELFYKEIYKAAIFSGIGISVGDGCPDLKLKSGLEAVKQQNEKAFVFFKPYENEKIFQRIEWALPAAKTLGVDIDSFNIATMKNFVKLEKKSASQLLEIKKIANKTLPFVVKGVFTDEQVKMMAEVKPDVIYISNHGGRVENRTGSTAEFMQKNIAELKNYCGEVWVDGGIRTREDFIAAIALGAEKILLGRPAISALCAGGKEKVREMVENLIF